MKIGITGANGLLGFHIHALLFAQYNKYEIRLANRDTFIENDLLDVFVKGLDVIIHCAGMNRGVDAEVEFTNKWLAEKLVNSLARTDSKAAVAYTNSNHIDRDTAYGRGKRAAADLIEKSGRERDAAVLNAVLPHVFGEFGKPFYNSVVSTFCHQLSIGEEPSIIVDGDLELVHAQAVARLIINWIDSSSRNSSGTMQHRMVGREMKVSAMLAHLNKLADRYTQNIIPDLQDPFDLALFNTFRSYLFPAHYPRALQLHNDARGALFEAVKSDQGGQTFVSTTHPAITRGNHYHLHKVERFLVMHGEAEIKLRKLFSEQVITFLVNGKQPVVIDIPTFHTHCITNIGAGELQTLFWANEIFDPNAADTYSEVVEK